MKDHAIKNPYSETCQKVNWNRRKFRRGKISGVEKYKGQRFGNNCTCDFWISRGQLNEGYDGSANALVCYDCGTEWTRISNA